MTLTKISTGGVKDDAASQAKIADEAIDEARLQVSNAGSNGQFLSKQSGNTGGLTWATVTVPDSDKIEEGNTSVETVDTGSDGHVKITTEGTERVRVTNDGKVGIGVTPSHPLHLKTQSGSGNEEIKIESESGYDASLLLDTSNGGGAGAHIHFQMDGGTKGGIEYVNNASSSDVNCMKFRTNTNAERFQIGASGQLGVAGANYGTSGQVLTSGGTSAAPSWAAVPAGGNTFTAVANGAIANNKAVQIDTDGKVSQVAESTIARTHPQIVSGNNSNGTNVTGNNENAYAIKCCYVGNSKLLIAWVVDGYPSSGKVGGKAVIGSRTSEGDFGSFGSVFNWASNVGFSHTWDVSWDETNNTIIFSYRDDDIGSGKGYSRFCKYNTSTNAISDISSGNTTAQWRNSSDTRSVKTYWDNSIQRLLLTYQAGNNQGGHSVVMAKNSSDDSYGATYAGDWTSVSGNSSVIQDQETCMTGLTSGKVVGFWNATDGNFYYSIGIVNTSNNTITWGSKVNAKGDEQMYPDCAYNADKNIIAFTGRHTGGSNNPYIHFANFADSNSTIGSWTGSEINSGGTESTNIVYCPDAKNLQVLYMVGSDPNNFKLLAYTHTSAGTAGTFNVSNHMSFLGETSPSGENFSQMRKMAAIAGHGAVAACARATTMNNKNVLNVFSTTQTTSSLTSQNAFVGFADQAYTNGQTATIKTYGNNVDTLSGLTAGSLAYIQTDGSISTNSSSYKAGLCLSSSKVLIKES